MSDPAPPYWLPRYTDVLFWLGSDWTICDVDWRPIPESLDLELPFPWSDDGLGRCQLKLERSDGVRAVVKEPTAYMYLDRFSLQQWIGLFNMVRKGESPKNSFIYSECVTWVYSVKTLPESQQTDCAMMTPEKLAATIKEVAKLRDGVTVERGKQMVTAAIDQVIKNIEAHNAKVIADLRAIRNQEGQ